MILGERIGVSLDVSEAVLAFNRAGFAGERYRQGQPVTGVVIAPLSRIEIPKETDDERRVADHR